MKRALDPLNSTRRKVLKASLLGTVGTSLSTTTAALAKPLFDLDSSGLRDLALKVTGALPSDLCHESMIALAQQMGSWATSSATDADAMLQLLHTDDLACERVWEVQGLCFSRTQIGLLASLVRQTGAEA